ncbi:MAG: glucosaminidase domain-containing protein, partial [Bacteroidaceae bacterium]
DLIWYTATKQPNGTYRASVNIRDHHYTAGGTPFKYLADVYVADNAGNLLYCSSSSVSMNFTGVVNTYPIIGMPSITIDKMVTAFTSRNKIYPSGVYAQYGAPYIRDFCTQLYEEAVAEGVKPEVLFVQAMHETGWLQFGGDVQNWQCNFGGLGAVDSISGDPNVPVKGADFSIYGSSAVRIGLRAQTQHLKAYASTSLSYANLIVDPRWGLVTKGCAPNVEDLGGKWASGSQYGYTLIALLQQIL